MAYKSWGDTWYYISEDYLRKQCSDEFDKLDLLLDEYDINFTDFALIVEDNDYEMYNLDNKQRKNLIKLYRKIIRKIKKQNDLKIFLYNFSSDIHSVDYQNVIDGINIDADKYAWIVKNAISINPQFKSLIKKNFATEAYTVLGG